jgi:protein-S-isoprenylcysteine O-methyltransferase Ste14
MGEATAIKEGFTARGGWWVIFQGLLTAAVVALGLVYSGERRALLQVVGGILFVLAAVVGLAGLAAQGRGLTPFPKPRPDTCLLQVGVYGLVRHPLYVCNLSAFFGWAFFRDSLPAGAGALAGAVFFSLKARREESWLRERFPDYAAYQKRVKRFIPWIY